MINPRPLLFSLALCCAVTITAQAAPVRSNANPRTLAYGTKYLLPRGSLIGTSETALRRLFGALRQHNTPAIVDLVGRYELERLIRDAVATPVSPRSGGMVEVQIPGFVGTVVTQRGNLIAR